MKRVKLVTVTFLLVLLSGCYSYGGYKPVIDTQNDRFGYRLNDDAANCRILAQNSAGGGTAKQTAIGTGLGAVAGAGIGAVVGAFTGNPGTAAGIGAAAGGLLGGAKEGFTSEDRFRLAYNQCMSGRGHPVIR
jgi:outer membrane lipoprotein SlyB